MDRTFQKRLAAAVEATDAALDRLLSAKPGKGEIARPSRLVEAMRYAALGGGKRLRPFLLIEAARIFGRRGKSIVAAAAALECVHCYSLVHDDLPAMDDDDLRRGRPTVHRRFDEATAILAGDALLTMAFDILAGLDEEPAIVTALVAGLARAAGIGGMAGGQMLDLEAERSKVDASAVARLQAMKTGALFRYACEAGAILGKAGPADRKRLAVFGHLIGVAFQRADDLIDATGDTKKAGKRTAKDAGRGKATMVALQGIEASRAELHDAVAAVADLLAPFGDRGATLAAAARFIAERSE